MSNIQCWQKIYVEIWYQRKTYSYTIS
jgi:hypothetical protein